MTTDRVQAGAQRWAGRAIVALSLLSGGAGAVHAQTATHVATELKLPSSTTGCTRPMVNARGDVLAQCGYNLSLIHI